MAREDWDKLLTEAFGPDPKRALLAYREIDDNQLPWLEQRVVALAVREQYSFAHIARLLGRTRQSVHAKFHTIVARPAPPTPAVPARSSRHRRPRTRGSGGMVTLRSPG
jgi:hypothetical protein